MGPLVPDIIGNELNFVVALFIGIAFGYILEQAGFSTSKKLVGLFYGYDFTVLRVFFTAGVTAMLGLIVLDHFGLIDMDIVYINPTFLYSAIVGGLIMGLGFVIGGFCPGTSVCAAAIGKIDAMYFILGSFLGILIFAEGYPVFESLYISTDYGFLRIFDTVGTSQGIFAFLLTSVAIGAFWFTGYIENRVNKTSQNKIELKRIYIPLSLLGVVLGISAILMPSKKEILENKIADHTFINNYNVKAMDSEELAFRLIREDADLQIFDLRNKKNYDSLALPASSKIEIKEIYNKDFQKIISVKGKRNLFIASEEVEAKKAAIIAIELGYKNSYYLKGGMNSFINNILKFNELPGDNLTRQNRDTYRFRKEAAPVITELIEKFKLTKTKSSGEKKSKRVIGGC